LRFPAGWSIGLLPGTVVVTAEPMAWILVVDDEPSVRGALVGRLRAMRHRCVEAANGLEALEELHEREFDLVLTDVMMPELNGFQFLERALPYIEGRTPVVILSSVEDRGGVEAALDAGAYDWLTKPADSEEVERVVESALERRAENLRLVGRHRGRRGPVPAEALGPRPGDRVTAPPGQEPAGVPAFRQTRTVVSIPRPGQIALSAAHAGSWWRRLRKLFRPAA
jgi:CheY-like chemotaxis protein